ncbi:RNA polymerase sigma factor [Streptomyces sp. NPDC058086]|uniref:RNA polymerase sigma factor n=1 Tax=Streptomyces sp. NPDC058086 TaxID=3346334 RepID=UPI0036E8E9B0
MTNDEFEAFFQKDYPNLIRHLTLQGFPRDLVADAAQEAMLRLLKERDNVSQPKAWVRQTARRIASDICKRDAKRDLLARHEAERPAPGPARPDAVVEEQSEAAEVLQVLRGLSDRQRETMAWHFDGYRPEEIAKFLGTERATVDSNLRHARRKLRQVWSDRRGEAT